MTAARKFLAGPVRRQIRLTVWAALAAIALACATQPAFAQSGPSISKGFSPIGIQPNGVSTLSFTLSNPNNATTLTGVAFTDNFPANLVVATPNNLTNTCGGTPTATAGSGSVSFTGGTITSGSSCTITVSVTASFTGNYLNVTGAVTSNQATGGTASASLAVANPPTISKLFLPNSISATGTTLLSFVLTNPNSNSTPPSSNVSLTGVSFTDAFPAGLVVASPNGLSNSCGGTVTAVAGATSLSLTGGNIVPFANENGGECFISVQVTARNTGTYNNTTGAISSNQSGPGATSNTASLTVTAAAAPTISKSFGAASIALGGSTTLSFVIANSNTGSLTGVGFTDTLPAGLVVSNSNALSNSCGGTATATPGSSSISLSGATAQPGNCNLSVSVTGTSAGVKNNTTGPITSDATGPAAPSNTASITVNQGSSSTSVVSSLNPSLSGQSVTFTATVSGPGATPTGSVTFLDGSSSLGTAPLSGATAAFTTNTLAVGSHTITARYGGDANFTSSTSGAVTQVVNSSAPAVTSVSPNSGPTTGGTTVTITGIKFTGATAVKFGSAPATSFTVNSDTSITATSPAGTAIVDVTVTTAGGTSPTSPADQFTYSLLVPTVTSVSPNTGATVGGTSVTVTGTNFIGTTAVKFGTTAATSFTVNSATSITATSPAGTGTVDLTVTTPGGTSATVAADHFTFVLLAPTVTSVSPNTGPASGGTSVTITGANFTGATAVKFGTTAATSFAVNSATSITATSPAGTGTVDVTVTTPGGTSAAVSADQFTYVLPLPTVASVSPNNGPPGGGTSVTITGTNFTGVTAVTFGTTAASSFTVNSATSITATSPAGSGTVDVTVTTAAGTSVTGSGDQFNFKATTTTSLSSSINPSSFGQPVTFTAKVTGSSPAGPVTFLDGSSAIGTVTLASGTAALTTSALTTGTHSITATYGGDSNNAPSASAVLVQTVNIPAASIRLREMELLTMPMAAQLFGQAVTGATNAAISAGFNGNPQPFTANGSGFTYYFGVDPENQAAANSSTDDGVKRFVASPDGTGSKLDRDFGGSRFDSDFNALGYAGPTKAPPKPVAQPRDWLAWIDVRGAQFNRSPTATATSPDLLGGQVDAIAGLTHRFTPDVVAGVLGGYEHFDFSSQALDSHLKGDAWTTGAFFGWRLTQNIRFDATATWSDVSAGAIADAAFGNFTGQRWLVASGLTGTWGWRSLEFEPSARVYALWEHDNAFVDSLGTPQGANDFSTGRASGGMKVTYPWAWSPTLNLGPYVGLYADYYFSREDTGALALTTAPLLQGWAARVTGGLSMAFKGGGTVNVGAEYSGLGANTQIWTFIARGSVPLKSE
jgi:hypothetical protein